MFRMMRTFANPLTRTAMIAFVWSHRRTIMRWGRSFWNELRHPGRIDPKRLTLIGQVLWTITSDERLANARQLRNVSLDGTTLVVDASSGWNGTAQLVDQLSKIKGVGAITDSKGRPLHGSIPTTIVA